MCAVLKIILANLPFAELRLRDARCQALTADVGRVPHMQTLPGHPHGDAQEPPRSRGPTGGAWWRLWETHRSKHREERLPQPSGLEPVLIWSV